jgi:hypothetical protein
LNWEGEGIEDDETVALDTTLHKTHDLIYSSGASVNDLIWVAEIQCTEEKALLGVRRTIFIKAIAEILQLLK